MPGHRYHKQCYNMFRSLSDAGPGRHQKKKLSKTVSPWEILILILLLSSALLAWNFTIKHEPGHNSVYVLTVKAQISLCIRTGWSEPSLST